MYRWGIYHRNRNLRQLRIGAVSRPRWRISSRLRRCVWAIADQERGEAARFGTLSVRRCAAVPAPWLATLPRDAWPATDGGGGTGSRGRTPTGVVDATQPARAVPRRRAAEIVTIMRISCSTRIAAEARPYGREVESCTIQESCISGLLGGGAKPSYQS